MKNENYLINEINNLVAEKSEILRQTINTERYSVILTGLIWWWLIKDSALLESSISLFVSIVPSIITVLGVIRNMGLDKRKKLIDNYILNVEKSISENTVFWTQYKNIERKKLSEIKVSAMAFWGILFVTNIICLILHLIN